MSEDSNKVAETLVSNRRDFIKQGAFLGAATLAGGVGMSVSSGAWAAGSDKPEKTQVKVGFIPLTDCASIVVAAAMGFDKKYGIEIIPSKEASWAGVRDKLVNGELDASHVLYGLIYGVQLGIGGIKNDMAVLMNLNNNGQGITLSRQLLDQGVKDGPSLAKHIKANPREYTFANTFPTGTHAMWLNYWLASQGVNPLKDVKVRKALYQAIDMDTIHRVTMRGLSQNTGALVAPQVNGWTKAVDTRFPYSQDASKKLLAEAGYPNGFEVDFACPNNRYINDEEICQAITAMWAKVGVKAKLRTLPLVTYFPMIQRYEASIYMLGWGVPTFDALYSLQSLTRTVGTGGDGNYNVGRYTNTRMDYIVDRIKTEVDFPVRNRLMTEGLQLASDTVSHIPLHNQVIPWAMKKNVDVIHRADNRLDWSLIKVN